MLYFSICLTLLVLLASIHLLIKIQKEGLGSFFKWCSYLVMLVAVGILLSQLVCGIIRMSHHACSRPGMECCDGMRGGRMWHRDGMNCCRGNDCSNEKCGNGRCDDGKMKCDKDSSSCCKDMKGEKEKDTKTDKK